MAKNTNTFMNDIKNYDIIRNVLRHIYMFGNYSKGDIVNKNLIKSERSCYDILKRISNYLGGEYLNTHKLPNRKKDKNGYLLKYDPFLCPINYLADTYQNCSYVIEDFIFYMAFLQAFKISSEEFPYLMLEQGDDASELTYDSEFDYDKLIGNIRDILEMNEKVVRYTKGLGDSIQENADDVITNSKAYDRFNELKDLGYIVKVYDKNNKPYYKLCDDILADLDSQELNSLLIMIQFFYNCSFLTIPGYFSASTLESYIVIKTDKSDIVFHNTQKNPVFFYKNNSIQNVIDDNVTWDILNAIHSSKPIVYQYRKKDGTITEFTALPIKIIIEKQYGRHYYFGYNYTYNNFFIQRLDSISYLNQIAEPNFNLYPFLEEPDAENIKDLLNNIYESYMEDVWNIATSDTKTKVVIDFYFEDKDYSKGLFRVSSTGRKGVIEEINPNHFQFSVIAQNESELIPWIRSFGSNAIVNKELSPTLYDKMKLDSEEVLKLYEII